MGLHLFITSIGNKYEDDFVCGPTYQLYLFTPLSLLVINLDFGICLQVIDLELPITVKLAVVDVDPGLKGDTAQGNFTWLS